MMMRGVLVLLFLGACADVHLGDDYGRKTKVALEAQAAAAGSGDSMLDAEDAKIILNKHRNKTPQPGSTAGSIYTAPITIGTGGGTTMPGQGSVVAPIKLESVR